MALAFLLGRIILGLYWLEVAYNHIFRSAGLVGYAEMKGVRPAQLAVVGSGILALIGGASILLGIRPHYGIAALVVFLIGVSFKMHAYWKDADPAQRMGDRTNFMKNMALLGALLAMYAVAQPWVYSLGW